MSRGKTLVLDNGLVQVRYDARTGTFTARRGELTFITEGRLIEPGAGKAEGAKPIDVRDALGAGKAVEVTWPGGRVRRLALYDSLPFVCATGSVSNASDKPITVEQITPLTARLDVGAPPEKLRGFGPAGLYELGERTHFCFAAAVEPKTRAGVVSGWLSHHRGSGVVELGAADGALRLSGRCEYGRLLVAPKTTADSEVFAVGWFDDALVGLEAYAAGCARAMEIKLSGPAPSGYCTWYHARALDEKRMAELAEFCGERLKPFGLEFLQIDDGWQVGGRDFTTHNPKGKYASGMKATAEAITARGLTAGIWYIPFGWSPDCKALAENADWFVKRPDGSIYSVKWAGSCLDMTHPEARKFLREIVSRMSRQWGYKYIKVDGLWSGMAVKILYPSPAYRPDELGQAVFHDPNHTNVSAYRAGLKLVREAAGDDVFILGCNIAQNARTLGGSFGLVDGMRIGRDIGANWPKIRQCAEPTARFYFLHNKVWYNDPDCLMLRKPLTLDQARAWGSLLAISGQMNVVSEWLPGLPAEKLDVVKRTMPNHGGVGRPLDLFESNPPKIWHYRTKVGGERLDVVCLVNWDDKKPARMAIDPARLGLPAGKDDRYVGFDYWENAFVEPFSGRHRMELRPSSCRVIAIGRDRGRPQLVGTSRHVTQGAIDVAAVEWDAAARTLTGRSKVVGGDPYELRIFSPRGGAKSAEAGGAKARLTREGTEVRVTIESPTSREVAWKVSFD